MSWHYSIFKIDAPALSLLSSALKNCSKAPQYAQTPEMDKLSTKLGLLPQHAPAAQPDCVRRQPENLNHRFNFMGGVRGTKEGLEMCAFFSVEVCYL